MFDPVAEFVRQWIAEHPMSAAIILYLVPGVAVMLLTAWVLDRTVEAERVRALSAGVGYTPPRGIDAGVFGPIILFAWPAVVLAFVFYCCGLAFLGLVRAGRNLSGVRVSERAYFPGQAVPDDPFGPAKPGGRP